MKQVAVTPEGKAVIDGEAVFTMRSSCGVDLEDILFHFNSKDLVVDWYGFIKAAYIAGWPRKKIESAVSTAVKSQYGNEYYKQFDVKFQEALGVGDRK